MIDFQFIIKIIRLINIRKNYKEINNFFDLGKFIVSTYRKIESTIENVLHAEDSTQMSGVL
jgi:hypothetical protein